MSKDKSDFLKRLDGDDPAPDGEPARIRKLSEGAEAFLRRLADGDDDDGKALAAFKERAGIQRSATERRLIEGFRRRLDGDDKRDGTDLAEIEAELAALKRKAGIAP